MTAAKRRVGILISGRGSNMTALIAAARAPDYPAEIACVVSNQPDAAALECAKQAGIPTDVVDHKQFADRSTFEAALDAALKAHGAEFVACAGFMRIMSKEFVERWRDR